MILDEDNVYLEELTGVRALATVIAVINPGVSIFLQNYAAGSTSAMPGEGVRVKINLNKGEHGEQLLILILCI